MSEPTKPAATPENLPRPNPATHGQRVMIILIAALAVVLALLISVTVFLQRVTQPSSVIANSRGQTQENEKDQSLPNLGKVKDFTLTTQDEKETAWSQWKNKVVIVDFIFTRCQGPCPRMTARMAQIQKLWKFEPEVKSHRNEGDLKLVSISVDPDNDTPEVLRNYAKMVDADLSQWTFLRGSREQIIETATHSFRVPVEIAPVGSNEPIMHTQKFVLVDRAGNIRGYYNGLDAEAYSKLQTDLQILLTASSEPGRPDPVTPATH